MDPISSSAVFAGMNACFKFVEYACRIAEVGSENDVFIRTIQVVRNDLGEVERLLGVDSVKARLNGTAAKADWIKCGIHSTRIALYQIGKWVERARVEQQSTGFISVETRFRWVFNDHEKLRNRQTELSACHQQLSSILAYLQPLEEAKVNPNPPSFSDVTSYDDILSPRQRWRASMQGKKPAASFSAENTNRNRPCLPDRAETFPLTAPTSEATSTVPGPLFSDLTFESHLIDPAPEPDFPSCPSSPPPTYKAATQSKVTGRPTDPVEQGPSDALHGDRPSHGIRTCESVPLKEGRNVQSTSDKKPEIFEYRDALYASNSTNSHVDTWSLSGTNHSGPVDPLELFHELPGSQVHGSQALYEKKINSPMEMYELLGHMSFPAELPADADPGPPPGYPRRRFDGATVTKPAISRRDNTSPPAGTSTIYALPSPDLSLQRARAITRKQLPSRHTTSSRTSPHDFLPEVVIPSKNAEQWLAVPVSTLPEAVAPSSQRLHQRASSASLSPEVLRPSFESVHTRFDPPSPLPSRPNTAVGFERNGSSDSAPGPRHQSLGSSFPKQETQNQDHETRPITNSSTSYSRMRNQKEAIELLEALNIA